MNVCNILLSAIVITILLKGSAFALEAVCSGQDIRQVADEGALVVSDLAITRAPNNCPTRKDHIGTTFSIIPHSPVYIWFRIEGKERFLYNIKQNSRFNIHLKRRGDLSENVYYLRIFNGELNTNALRMEAAQNAGYFDWRFGAQIEAFHVPGDYRIKISFGNKAVCFSEGGCELRFRVEP